MATKKRLTRKKPTNIVAVQTKTKPQLIINAMSLKQKVTIYVSGGRVDDIVKENCPELNIEVHDYDIGDMEDNLHQDEKGRSFLCFEF
jgi:hypothetical protein